MTMRNPMLLTMLILPVLVIPAVSAECAYSGPFREAFGYSSEESSGGGSYLGVDTRDVTAERLTALQLKEEHGVEITMVDQDAPAGKSGLKEHDVILRVNGTEVESVEQLRRMIHEIPAGRLVTLGVSRNGQALTIKAQLASRKKSFSLAKGEKEFKFEMPEIPPIPVMPDIDVPVSIVVVHSSTRSGLMIENLTPQLGDYFGVKNGQGVLVRSVEKGSRAEKAGFRAGDVVVRVNGETVNDAGDFTHAVRSRKDNKAAIGIIRDKKEQTITLTLPEGRSRGEIINESLDIPEIDAETRMSLTKAEAEIARMRPQIERAVRQMSTAEFKRIQPQIDRATKQVCTHKEELNQELNKEMLEIQREFVEHGQELNKALEHLGRSAADI
jgi:membrane-associated protease RseP (regulator of RpoE activity)